MCPLATESLGEHSNPKSLFRANGGLPVETETLIKQLRLHLYRGVGYMAVYGVIKRIDDLVRLAKDV